MKLALFLTHGSSLRDWVTSGTYSREMSLYKKLADHFEKIYIVSYGSDTLDAAYTSENIEILTNNYLPNFLYGLLAPIIHRRKLKTATYLKTNQTHGAIPAVITKLLFHNKLIIRQGYQWLYTLEQKNASNLHKAVAYLTERLAYKHADKIIVTSEYQEKYITKNYNIFDNIHVIPNFVDTYVFKPIPMPQISYHMLYIGRLAPEKNLINLIDAVKDMPVELKIIGDGPMKKELQHKLSSEHITNVAIRSRVINARLPEIINQHRIYIQVSLYEGNPKTILEAMACGSIVIGTNVSGIRNIISDAWNGFLCYPTVDSIKKTIDLVINASDFDLDPIIDEARKTIEEKYSLNIILTKELKIYEETS